jgi:hypothetical protein
MSYALTSPLSVNQWVCGGDVNNINGDLCCGSALIPRSKRSLDFQATVQSMEAMIALGQQNKSRDIDSIVQAAIQLNPKETQITSEMIRNAVLKGKKMMLFTLVDNQYCVDAKAASGRVDLYPYLPFIQEFSPFRIKYPELVIEVNPI